MSWLDDLQIWLNDHIFDRDAVNDGLADHGYFDDEEITEDDSEEESW